MPNPINTRALLREMQTDPAQALADLSEAIDLREIDLADVSLRGLATALIEDGREWLDWIDTRKGGGAASMLEATTAVDTGSFANITGQLVFNKVKDSYESPEFLWPQLCENVQTAFLDGERIPGIGELGDVGEVIEEGREFPYVGTNEEWLQTVPTAKRGFIVPLTREVLVADRTGVLVTRCSGGGRWLGYGLEKRTLDVAVGVVNNYNRNGVASNTYLTSGAYINSQTGNALDASGNEWRALERAELLFDAITDPNTGEPILAQAPADTMLVPTALKRTAIRILESTGVMTVDARPNAATIRTESSSPIGDLRSKVKVLSSPYVKLRTGSSTAWFYGAFKRAIYRMVVWDIEALQAPGNSEAEFRSEIMQRFKVGVRDAVQMAEPRFLCKNDQ